MKTKVIISFLIVLNLNVINSGRLLNTIDKNVTTISPTKTTVPPSRSERQIGVAATAANNTTSSSKSTFKSNATNNNIELGKTTTTKKNYPPKKYAPPISSTYTENGPTKIILAKSSLSSTTPSDELLCPKENEAQYNLFAPSCETDHDCTVLKKEQKCCKLFGSKNCIKGIPRPVEDHPHSPLLGIIPRECPQIPLAELWWDLKQCESDSECWPRICCPDGHQRFCRAPTVKYNAMPRQLGRPLAYLSEYLECTPPPPPIFDLHPKKCESTFDCFPNVCCQEAGKKHCRPPKKSVLTFMAGFLNTGLVKRLTANIVIK